MTTDQSPESALQSVLDELRRLRLEIMTNKSMLGGLAIRIGISQMRGREISTTDQKDGEWDKLLALWEAGRLAIDNTGEVHVDCKRLTEELLNQATTQKDT